MEITLVCYTKAEYLEICEITEAEFAEYYGADAVKLFSARCGEDEGAYVGVQCEDGSCNVYGLGMDEDYVTFGRMLERLVGEFM